MKLDILAIGAHPDDVELSCSGVLAKEASRGKKTGILDLTRGELGTRGSAEIRDQEAAAAAKVLGFPKGIQEIYDEWSNFTENMEKELGLKTFDRQIINPDKIFTILKNETMEVSFYLQKNIKIQFWTAFTFANTRVSDKYKLEPKEKTQFCPHPFTDFGVLWNGDVSLCCLDYDATLNVGNVNTHSVEDVMKNKASNKLRASMHGLEKLHPTCVKCQSRPVEK